MSMLLIMILFEYDRMICFTYGSLIVWVFLLSVRLISIMAALNIYKLPFDDRWRFDCAAQNKAPLRRYINIPYSIIHLPMIFIDLLFVIFVHEITWMYSEWNRIQFVLFSTQLEQELKCSLRKIIVIFFKKKPWSISWDSVLLLWDSSYSATILCCVRMFVNAMC